MRSNTSLERTRDRQSAKLKSRRARRSAQPLAPMDSTEGFARSFRTAPYLPVVAALILLLRLLGASFSHSCQSDGCIGVAVFTAAAAFLLAVQLMICLPVFHSRCRRRGEPAGLSLAAWAAISIACFWLPLGLMK
jgi:hypothetical protein